MDVKERSIQLVNELINGIDAGDFDCIENIPDKYTYEHLWGLFMLSDILDDGRALYEQIYDLFIEHGKYRVKQKLQAGEKIKVAFLAISAAEWPAEGIYRAFEQDECIESYVVVSPLIDRDVASRKETYQNTLKYFRNGNYQVRESYDAENDSYVSWEAIGGMPDIVIHLTSWMQSLPKEYRITSFPLSCLSCYVPYGFYVADSEDGSYLRNSVYDKEFVNMMWKVYADSEKNLRGYQSYEMLHGKNVIYSGYAKMDFFYKERVWKEEEVRELWKIPEGKAAADMKKIIIAPHHAILGYAGIKFSTFPKNAHFLLYLAKKYQDTITFVYKPHPNLKLRAVEAGVFESHEAYEEYLEEWNRLPNAKVVQEADYLTLFDTSDGMIMDSASFLGEYMYVNKPLLFLTRKGQAFNELGRSLLDGYYLERGENYYEIEQFIQKVILEGQDVKGEKRLEIFENELDYVRKNKQEACEYIYRNMMESLAE